MTGARVEAVVTGGVATLTGSVQNQTQKALAAKAATDTPGVTSVKNKLQINPTGGAKSAAASKPPVTKVIVVHARKIVVRKRVCVQHLDRGREARHVAPAARSAI